MSSSLRDIYNALREDRQFSQTKDYGTFERRMNERGYSQMIYNNLKSAGAKLPDVNTFRKKIGVKDWSAATTKPVAKTTTKPATSSAEVKDKYQYPGISTPKENTGVHSQLVESLYNQDADRRERERRVSYTDTTYPMGKRVKAEREKAKTETVKAVKGITEEGSQPAYPELGSVSKRKAEVADIHMKTRDAALKAWDIADNTTRDNNQYTYGGGFYTDALNNNINNYAESLKQHDLQKMSDDAWNALGTDGQNALAGDIASKLMEQYPDANHKEVYDYAMQMARAESDQHMYDVAVEKNMPKNVVEFFLRKAVGETSVGKALAGAARIKADTRGDMEANDDAMAQYEQSHKTAGVLGSVAGFAGDPLTVAAGGAGGALAKAGTKMVGKITGKILGTAAGEAATRQAMTTTLGKVFQGSMAGAGNLGTFEAGGELAEQFRMGGYRDEDGKLIDGFSMDNVAGKLAHGATMGLVTGAVSPIIGNVTDKAVRATESTAGKMVTRFGGAALGTVAEGTIFSVPEWMEGKRDAMDVWNDNMAMMVGMKVPHLVKSVPAVIDGLRGDGVRAKMNVSERMRNILDGNRQDLNLTKDEKAELESGGYGDITEMVNHLGSHRAKIRETRNDKGKTMTIQDDMAKTDLDFNKFEDLMNDKNISEAARAKMYYYLTGRMLPMSTVMGGGITEVKDADQKVVGYTVESTGANGVITRKHFKDKKSADKELATITRQAELNSFDTGERLYNGRESQKRMREACSIVADREGVGAEDLYKLMTGERKAEEGDRPYMNAVRESYNDLDGGYGIDVLRSEILDNTGVDVTEAIKKQRGERTEEEQAALDEYSKALYDSVSPEEAPTDAFRMNEAEKEGASIVVGGRLGTESPDTEAVANTMGELKAAQEAWLDAMSKDDALKEGFEAAKEKGMGLTEAYQWMIEKGYGTEESLVPLADVVSATVKAQAVFKGTQEAIAKNVEEHVSTWQWEGHDYGMGETDKPIMLYVEGKDGHKLIVKSGNVKFDDKGNATQGDMLICLDTVTNKMVYPSVKDVKFMGTEDAEAYGARYREHLEEINNEAYKPAEEAAVEGESDVPVEEGKIPTEEGEPIEEGKPEGEKTEEIPVKPAEEVPAEPKEEVPAEGKDEVPVEETPAENVTPAADESGIPLDEEGEPMYESIPVARTVEDLYVKLGDGNLARQFAEAKEAEAEKAVAAIKKKAPKMTTKINEFVKKKAEYDAALKAAADAVEYWKSVKEQVEKDTHTTPEEVKEAKGELDGTNAREAYKETLGSEKDVPESGVALAASVLADAKVTPESLKKESGYGTKDLNKFVGMLAKKENGGVDLMRLAERLVEMDEEYNNRFFGGDAQNARNALLEALGMAKTRGELREVAGSQKEKEFVENYNAERDKQIHEQYNMSYEDYLDYREQEIPRIVKEMSGFDEAKFLEEHAVELIEQLDKEYGKGNEGHESAGEEPVHGTGEEVLSGEGADKSGRGAVVEGHGDGNEEVRGGDREDAALEEGASGGVEVEESHKTSGENVGLYDNGNSEAGFSKRTDKPVSVSHNERVLRDAVDERLRESGMEAIGDVADDGKKFREGITEEDATSPHFKSTAEEGTTESHPVEKVVERIAETCRKVGSEVKQVNSVDEITDERVKAEIASGKKVRGWYDEKTGQVYLYMPNIHDAYTAEKTVCHETVGHKGMRGLLGKDGHRKWLKSLWMDMDNPVNAELRAYVKDRMAKDGLSMYDAIEEFVADSAEKGKGEAGFWNNIKNKVIDALHEIGYRINPNVKDVQYMLWLAKNVQKHPNDPVWAMRADAVKWKIDHREMEMTPEAHGEYTDPNVKPKSWDEMTDEELDESCTIHFATTPTAATEIDQYNKAVGCKSAMLKESYVDKMNSVKELMKVLIPGFKNVEDAKATVNPVMAENLMASQISARGRKFAGQEMKRLETAFSGILDSFGKGSAAEKTRAANLYMITKHGLERNRVFFVRDKLAKIRETNEVLANQIQGQFDSMRKNLGTQLSNGSIDLREYYKQMDEWICKVIDKGYKAGEHDYSGMHGVQGISSNLAPYDDVAAIGDVMSAEANMEGAKTGSVKALWDSVKEATNYAIHEEFRSGFISKSSYERLRDMFDWYVPLRKYDETTMEDIYTYINNTNASNTIGETIRAAKGRKSLSDVNLLAQIGAMADNSLYRGGGNIMRQAFARMIDEYEKGPEGGRIVTEIKSWAVKGTDSNGNAVWTEAHPPISATDTDQATIMEAYNQWNAQMEAKAKTGDAKQINGSDNIPYRFLSQADRSQHIVSVWMGGKRHDYLFNGNPRAAQALNGLVRNSVGDGHIVKALAATNRFMAQTVTSWNLEFMMRNTLRDSGFALHLLEGKEGTVYTARFLEHFAKMGLAPVYRSGKAMMNLSGKDLKNGLFVNMFKRYKNGTLDMSDQYHRWFAEFMDNGGMTGIVTNKRFDAWKKQIDKHVNLEHGGYVKNPVALVKDIFGGIEMLNEMAENITRFSTYCASRQSGRSMQRSAYDAHEVSVNFNRTGSGNGVSTYAWEGMGKGDKALRGTTGFFTSWMRNYTMFFNASVQSFYAFTKNVKNHPLRATASMMAYPVAIGMAMPFLNNILTAWMDDDDDKKKYHIPDNPYAELPDYIRRNNLCIYRGKGEFFTIPIGIETRAFYGLGDLAASYTFNPELQAQKNVVLDVAGQLSQIVPVGDFMNGSSFGSNPKADLVNFVNKFVPSPGTPVVEYVANIDWKGSPIYRGGDYLKDKPSWMAAKKGAAEPLVDFNKWVNGKTNGLVEGNENMKGSSYGAWMADAFTDPSLIEHLYDSYLGGMGTFGKRVAGLGTKRWHNATHDKDDQKDIETREVPFVRSLLYAPTPQSALARTKAKWYRYKEDLEQNSANLKELNKEIRDPKRTPEERMKASADWHNLSHSATAKRVKIYERAERQIKRLNKRKARTREDAFTNLLDEQINSIMEKAVKEMDAIK